MKRTLWKGLAHVEPVPGNDGFGCDEPCRAYVNIVGAAASEKGFEEGVRTFCEEWGFTLLELEDVASVVERRERSEVRRVARAISAEQPFGFGEFSVYSVDAEGEEGDAGEG